MPRSPTSALIYLLDEAFWKQQVDALPHFAEYPEKAGRVIPMVRLTPTATG